MSTIYAPFTEYQVVKLKEWQSGVILKNSLVGMTIPYPTHPFTCNSEDVSECSNEGILIPTTEGLHCPCGKYVQNWCFNYMVSDDEFGCEEVLKEVLKLTKEKGYNHYYSLVNPFNGEYWRHDILAFINHTCALLASWLREHKILVWVEPCGRPEGRQIYIAYCEIVSPSSRMKTVPILPERQSTYEFVWLAGIQHALKSLPLAAH